MAYNFPGPSFYNAGSKTSNFSIDFGANGTFQKVTLNSGTALSLSLLNPIAGATYFLEIVQGGSPSTINWPANVVWPNSNAPTLATTTGYGDLVSFFYDGIFFIANAYLKYNLIVLDPDATAFINAAGITDGTQKTAINQLVTDLKTYGLWTKMSAVYPFVGGTSTTCKFNLKDPRDLDAAYRATFSGGTFASTGWTPSGAYGDTHFSPSTLSVSSNHISIYSRTNSGSGTVIDCGCSDNNTEIPSFLLALNFSGKGTMYNVPNYSNGQVYFSPSTTAGFFCGTRSSNSLSKLYFNGNSQASDTNTVTDPSLPTTTFYLGAYHYYNGTAGSSGRELSFISFGTSLSDTDSTNLYTAVQSFQTTLGRQV